MFTSDIDQRRKGMAKTGFVYLIVSLFFVLFGAVYEYFSHQVFSYYMLYAFVFPLAGGALPFLLLALTELRLPEGLAVKLHHCGIAALTVGSIFQGALEIYGTMNRWVAIYWAVGALLLLTGAVLYRKRHGGGDVAERKPAVPPMKGVMM